MPKIAMLLGQYPGNERDRRAERVLSFATADVQVGIVPVPETPYVNGLTACEIALVTPSFVAAAQQAEREGYDGVVPFGMLDLGVEAARHVLRIPMVGPYQSVLRVASTLGDRFGVIVYHPQIIPFVRQQNVSYGVADRVVDVLTIGIDLPNLVDNLAEMRSRFVACARRLIDAGAEVIIPGGVSMCPIHMSAASLMEELGVPVVEGVGTPIRMAALLASFGLRPSLRRYPPTHIG